MFALVVKEVPAQLILVGDGPDRSAAEWLAHDLQIQEKVAFFGEAGSRERIATARRSHDYAQPTGIIWAGWRWKQWLARFRRLRPGFGGVPELIEDGITGLFVSGWKS